MGARVKGKKDKKKNKNKKPKKGKKKAKNPLAERADKYVLYQKSVQAPEADIEFFEQVFKEQFDRSPNTIKEDFCGTHAMACEWVKRNPESRAWGVDLDPEPLAWGTEHNQQGLSAAERERLTLIEGNVLDVREPKVDIVAAQNFSFCIFKSRELLRTYFASALDSLAEHGLFVLDIFGGPESQQPQEDGTEHSEAGFTYWWDQKRYDAITNEILCAIHFEFPDGSKLEDAFVYDWRLWTIAELRELLLEAGFKQAKAYWEGVDDDGEGDGNFTLTESEENEDAWIAYVVGVK